MGVATIRCRQGYRRDENFSDTQKAECRIITGFHPLRQYLMAQPTFEEFRARMLADGYDEVLERPWAPNAVAPLHTHPFEANALVVQGEMWLGVEGGTERRLVPGDRFHLQATVEHQERYGAQGATYWVARRGG